MKGVGSCALLVVMGVSACCLFAVTVAEPSSVQAQEATRSVAELERDLTSGRGEVLRELLQHATHDGPQLDTLTRLLTVIEQRGRVPVRKLAAVWSWTAETALSKGRPELARLAIERAIASWRKALTESETDSTVRLELASALLLADTIARDHPQPDASYNAADAGAALTQTLRWIHELGAQGQRATVHRAVRLAERAAARLLNAEPSPAEARAQLARVIETMEVLTGVTAEQRQGPSAAERLLQYAVRQAVRLGDFTALDHCLAIPGRLDDPWRPAAWYLTLVLADEELYRSLSRQTRDRFLEYCERWALAHPDDGASLDLRYRVLVRRYLHHRGAETYAALKQFWEQQGEAWRAEVQALHEDQVLAAWAALRWLAFGAARLGLVDDTQRWVREAEQLSQEHPSRKLRLDDLRQLPAQAAMSARPRSRRPTGLLLRLAAKLRSAPARLRPQAQRIARLVLARNVLRSWLKMSPDDRARARADRGNQLALAVAAYDGALRTQYCPADPNERCYEPNHPATDPNGCPLSIRNGWSPGVWRKWLAQPGFSVYVDVDGNGALDAADLSALEHWLEMELEIFDQQLHPSDGRR